MPMATAKFSAMPTAAMPRPKKICPNPNPTPNATINSNDLRATPWYTSHGSGMVMKTTAQGNTTIPNNPHTAQMFSHFHTLTYLMGAGKLPLMTPAIIESRIPKDILDMHYLRVIGAVDQSLRKLCCARFCEPE